MECYAREIVNSFGSNPCTFTYELEYPVDMTHDNWYVALNGYSKNFDIKFKGEEQGALLTANFLVRGGFGTATQPFLRYLDLSQSETHFTESELLFVKCENLFLEKFRVRLLDRKGDTLTPLTRSKRNQSLVRLTFLNTGPVNPDSDSDSDSETEEETKNKKKRRNTKKIKNVLKRRKTSL